MQGASRLFFFFGRARRREYWLVSLTANALFALIFYGLATYFLAHASRDLIALPILATILAALVIAGWANLAAGVRRLHDRDKTGWWVLIFYVAPFGLTLVGPQIKVGGVANVVTFLAAVGLVLWGFVELGVAPGTTGMNRYGGALDPSQAAKIFA